MKEIILTKGKSSIIDDEDYHLIMKWKWYANGREGKQYAARSEVNNGIKNIIYMHRLIMNCPQGLDIDHINGNRLDNRKINLRICSRSENLRNSNKRNNLSSKFKGVSFCKHTGKWRAFASINRKFKCLGRYKTQEEAAIVYKNAVKADKFSSINRTENNNG